MKIPKKIKVGPYKYEITTDKKSFDDYGIKTQDLDALGYTDERTNKIHIAPDVCTGLQRDIAMHEAMHVIYGLVGLTVTVGREKEELIVNSVATGVLQLIRDNPTFIEYLQQKD